MAQTEPTRNRPEEDQEAYERALRERKTKDLPGDMEKNLNVSGSTTYQTLTDPESDQEGTGERHEP
ncbi:MAG TPA: hypothetical protein VG106_11740 [Vicinamibacterales bacterium]|nr:hypothetical protein [Vicinamibacterales bacterium]